MKELLVSGVLLLVLSSAAIAAEGVFDGARWNVSTGNLSVSYIQHSPIGAHPLPDFLEPPPPFESLKKLHSQGLTAYEDYIAWGAVEREEGKWDWSQHDRMEKALHAAGLKYVVYDWVHFPPVWLREKGGWRTLMKCLEHRQETNYLSIFDPETIRWYDRFYKALAEHFGARIDGVYACILGPYGEGNYPLNVPDWVNIGHCHEGYWCADPYAVRAFREAMRARYHTIERLNSAWSSSYRSFSAVDYPEQIRNPLPAGQDTPHIAGASMKVGFVASADAFKTPGERRRWLDFIQWYHQAIIDFAGESIKTVLKYFPAEKVRTKPGGTAGGVNPIAWGTYSPGYAKMAAPYHIVLQPADCHGAYFGDKWLATAYKFYGVKLSTEPAGGLDRNTFVRRMFSDASCGASQLFTYEFEDHVPEIQKYIHLYTGASSETPVAILMPTTLYRLGADLAFTIKSAALLRDWTDYDVLDELLVQDGALDSYRTLIIIQGEYIEQEILSKISAWQKRGGRLIVCGGPVLNVEGKKWDFGSAEVLRPSDDAAETARAIAGVLCPDEKPDGVWTARRAGRTLLLNTSDHAVDVALRGRRVAVPPHEIVEVKSLPGATPSSLKRAGLR